LAQEIIRFSISAPIRVGLASLCDFIGVTKEENSFKKDDTEITTKELSELKVGLERVIWSRDRY